MGEPLGNSIRRCIYNRSRETWRNSTLVFGWMPKALGGCPTPRVARVFALGPPLAISGRTCWCEVNRWPERDTTYVAV